MNVYLVRHAEALPLGGAITRDADRILSPGGEEQARLMGRVLARLDTTVGMVLTSPLVRARCTGEIFASALPAQPLLESTENLAPGFRNKALLEELLSRQKGSIVAVGHQPDVGNFISWLVGDAAAVSLSVPACTMALLVIDPLSGESQGMLRWLLTPEVARQLVQTTS